MKYAQFIERVKFIHDFLTNVFGKDATEINTKLLNKQYYKIGDTQLIDYLDKFEYLYEVYKKYGLFTSGEIDVYFKGYIVPACNAQIVVDKLKEFDKQGRYHRGFKKFCCRYYSLLKYKDYYSPFCK